MKLRDEIDKISLLSEINRLDLMELETLEERHFQEVVESRAKLVKKTKDFRKSQDQKHNWTENRWKIMKGIKKWHKSTKGKKFHRQLGRHLATRIFSTKSGKLKESQISQLQLTLEDFLTPISSIRTHLYIDYGYYKPLYEQIDFEEMTEFIVESLNRIELELLRGNYDLNEDDLEVLLRLIDTEEVASIFNVTLSENDKDFFSSNYILSKITGEVKSG